MSFLKRLNHNSTFEKQVNELGGKMTLEEKIGQITQVKNNNLKQQHAGKYFIGSVFRVGGGYPLRNYLLSCTNQSMRGKIPRP